MCKRHWKEANQSAEETAKKIKQFEEEKPPPPEGESVYDLIIPQSIAFRPSSSVQPVAVAVAAAAAAAAGEAPDPWVPPPPPPAVVSPTELMPLVAFLRDNAVKPAGWHRNEERRARGVRPVPSLSCQLEAWERQLVSNLTVSGIGLRVCLLLPACALTCHIYPSHLIICHSFQALVEILLLSGGTPGANFKELAHAWGREKGFHHVLTDNVCKRRGEVERKRRSDIGKTLSEAEKASFKEKLQKARSRSGGADNDVVGEEADAEVVDEVQKVACSTSKSDVQVAGAATNPPAIMHISEV